MTETKSAYDLAKEAACEWCAQGMKICPCVVVACPHHVDRKNIHRDISGAVSYPCAAPSLNEFTEQQQTALVRLLTEQRDLYLKERDEQYVRNGEIILLRANLELQTERLKSLTDVITRAMEATGIARENPSGDLADDFANVMQAVVGKLEDCEIDKSRLQWLKEHIVSLGGGPGVDENRRLTYTFLPSYIAEPQWGNVFVREIDKWVARDAAIKEKQP